MMRIDAHLCALMRIGRRIMKTILIANQKGGSGKTLLSDTLATAFELDEVKTNFIDLDQQGGPIHQTKMDEDAAVQIVDTPGALQPELKEWIEDADYMIIPTMMSSRDIPPLIKTLEVYFDCNNKPPLLVVFNRWNKTNNTKNFIEWFEANYPEVTTAVLCDTVAFNDASARGLSIEQYRPRCNGAKQAREIYSLLKHQLKIKEGFR